MGGTAHRVVRPGAAQAGDLGEVVYLGDLAGGPIPVTAPGVTGTSTPFAGASGTVTVPQGARVVSVAAHSTSGGTMTLTNLGPANATFPVVANTAFGDGYSGLMGGSGGGSITFTGTDAYYVVLNQ